MPSRSGVPATLEAVCLTPRYPPIYNQPSRPRKQRRNITMAEKEATVYIVDMGMSMGEKRNARKESDLDWAMTYVWEKITSTVNALQLSLHDPI